MGCSSRRSVSRNAPCAVPAPLRKVLDPATVGVTASAPLHAPACTSGPRGHRPAGRRSSGGGVVDVAVVGPTVDDGFQGGPHDGGPRLHVAVGGPARGGEPSARAGAAPRVWARRRRRSRTRRMLAANPSRRRRRSVRVTEVAVRLGGLGGVVSPCSSDTGAESVTRIAVGAATAAPGASTAAAASSITRVAMCRIRRREVLGAAGMGAWGGPSDRTSTPNTPSDAAVSPLCDGSVNRSRCALSASAQRRR